MVSFNFPELNYCEKNQDTCKNGGKCQSLETNDGLYRCSCPPGISGKNCENLPEVAETTTTIEPGDVTNDTSTKEPSNGENETE